MDYQSKKAFEEKKECAVVLKSQIAKFPYACNMV
jgi:hypothetical protein